MLAALAGAVALTTPAGAARDPARAGAAAVAVESLDVEQVDELAPGVPLVFTVFGTPQSLAALRIEGGRRVLELRETGAGIYEGTYVIDDRDAIRPDSRVTASLQRNGAVAYSTLGEPLLLAQGTVPWREAGAAPTPGAPSAAPVPMATPMPMPIPTAVAPPRPVPPAVAFAATPPARERETCADCAVVESVRAVEAAPRGGVVGAIGGAIAGAILGKEAGEAHTRRVLTVLGAIGGALVGREIERQATRATRATQYDVVLRLPDGTRLNRRYEQAPPFAAGETIRIGTPAGRGAAVSASF
jgi:outer membrane lipoprotein SlyB